MSNEVKKNDKAPSDIHIVMEPKILQQIVSPLLKSLPHGMKNQINVIMINQVTSSSPDSSDNNFDFAKFLESLPEPRLESLRNLTFQTAYKMFHKTYQAADFLGICRKNYATRLKEIESGNKQDKLNELENKDKEEGK